MTYRQTNRLFAVLSTVKPDGIGQVARVSAVLREKGANIEAITANELGNLFATHFFFSAPPEAMDKITREIQDLLRDFSPHLVPVSAPKYSREEKALKYELSLIAFDKEGIVNELSELLAKYKVDIVSLYACSYAAPESGTPLFMVEAKLDVSRGTTLKALVADLFILEARRQWDVDLRVADESPGTGDTDLSRLDSPPFPPKRLAAQVARVRKADCFELAEER